MVTSPGYPTGNKIIVKELSMNTISRFMKMILLTGFFICIGCSGGGNDDGDSAPSGIDEATVRDAVSRILSGETDAESCEIEGETWEVGDAGTIQRAWGRVDVVNEEPVSSLNNEFQFGDSCVPKSGGTVLVMGFFENSDECRALFFYISPEDAGGTVCPSGVLYFHPSLNIISST
ncbi:MAG: hypothetical protein GY749_13710 [Desulfobacteraceae bacterium]|nr:hypothetical protein [Desulfobacteraceae bacterium]